MLGICLLVTMFSQLSAQNLLFTPAKPVQLNVSFPELNGVKIGSPVVLEGKTIGSVSRILDRHARVRPARFNVEVRIDSLHSVSIRKGTIALIASHLTSGKGSKAPVVELIAPAGNIERGVSSLLSDGAAILGFSSYEEFWKSPEQV
jgi:hypothetical protein